MIKIEINKYILSVSVLNISEIGYIITDMTGKNIASSYIETPKIFDSVNNKIIAITRSLKFIIDDYNSNMNRIVAFLVTVPEENTKKKIRSLYRMLGALIYMIYMDHKRLPKIFVEERILEAYKQEDCKPKMALLKNIGSELKEFPTYSQALCMKAADLFLNDKEYEQCLLANTEI